MSGIHLAIVNDAAEADPEKEVEYIRRYFNDLITPVRKVTSGRSIAVIDGVNVDALVFDYGGMAQAYAPNPIYDEMDMSLKWADDHPGKPLIIWSSYFADIYVRGFKKEIWHKPDNMIFFYGTLREHSGGEKEEVKLWLAQDALPSTTKGDSDE